MSLRTPPGDVFVTTANLDERRPAPKPSLLATITSSRSIRRIIGLIYFIIVIALWRPLVTALELRASVAVESLLLALVLCLPLIMLALVGGLRTQVRTGSPFYRDADFVRSAGEIVLLLLIIQAAATLLGNFQANISQSGLVIDFGVISRTPGVELTEGPDPRAQLDFLVNVPFFGESLAQMSALQPDSVLRALIVGFINTLRVSALALVATTILGIFVGVGLLTPNWLVRNVSAAFTEVFRNTPLLVQLFFLYNGVIKLLPARPREAVTLVPDAAYVSGRGLYYPALLSNDSSGLFWLIFFV